MLLKFTLLADPHWRITYGAVWAIGSAKVRKKAANPIDLRGFLADFISAAGWRRSILRKTGRRPGQILSLRLFLFVLLFLRLRRPDRQHPLAFHLRHAFQHTGFVQALGEFEQ